LGGADLESQFAALESGSDVDAELAAMKAQLGGASPSQGALPPTDTPKADPVAPPIDAELEELRRQMDQL
jgi:phage shock protein A